MKTTMLKQAAAAAALLTVAATASAQLKPFDATYQANYMGMPAVAKMSLDPAGAGQWKYSLSVSAKLGSARQSTTFDEAGGSWRPLSGQDSTNVLFKSDSRTATYDWNSKQATWSGKVKPDRRGPIALQPGDVDALLMNLAIVRDVNAGKPLHYRLVDNGKAKSVAFTSQGKEAVTVGGKTVQATKVSGDGITLWVAPGYPVPLRLLKNDDNIDLRLQSIN